jgi:hypothetical protein
MRWLGRKLTYANTIATLALFVALGGSSYAALTLPANSVGTRQLKKGAVTGEKVKSGSLNAEDFSASTKASLKGAKGDPGSQGPQGIQGLPGPPGAKGDTGSVPSPGASHTVGGTGEPAFTPCDGAGTAWVTLGAAPVKFYRDPFGVVRLEGHIQCNAGATRGRIFTLPAGYAPEQEQIFPQDGQPTSADNAPEPERIAVEANGDVFLSAGLHRNANLDGIAFRCAPSGANGCP